MGRFRDLTGERFGRLLVLQRDGANKHGQVKWWCECDCGVRKHVLGTLLTKGETKSCGCLHREVTSNVSKTHGMSKTPIWSIHRSMMDRCHLPTSQAYDRYGGRGIQVCERWQKFEDFYADMGDKPDGMSLERIDNDGDYCPENVRWASTKEQANNRRNSRWIEFNGQRKTLAQWAEEYGVKLGTLWSRLKLGIPMEEALVNKDRRYA